MKWMKQGTTFIMMPPALSTDGITAATGATLSTARIFISKNDAAFTAKASTKASSGDTRGNYRAFLTTVDSGTLGGLSVEARSTGEMLTLWADRMIVAEDAYDALRGNALFKTNVIEFNGSSQSLLDLKDFADDGWDPTNDEFTDKSSYALATAANDLITDVKKMGGSTQSLTDLKDFADVGYDPVAHDVETVKVVLALTANNDKTAYALTTVANDLITTNLSTFAKGDTVGSVILTTANNDLITTKLSTFAKGDTVGKVLLTTENNDLITTNLSTFKTPAGIPRGATFTLEVFMLSTDGKNPATESTVSAFFGPDGATFSTATNAVAETRHGWYKVDMTAAEMNYKEIKARFTATTCEDRNIVLIPSETA